eukprot:5099773-Prymnesium_polylepis.1
MPLPSPSERAHTRIPCNMPFHTSPALIWPSQVENDYLIYLGICAHTAQRSADQGDRKSCEDARTSPYRTRTTATLAPAHATVAYPAHARWATSSAVNSEPDERLRCTTGP